MSAVMPPVSLPAPTRLVGDARIGPESAYTLLLAGGGVVVLMEADERAISASRERVIRALRRSAEQGGLGGDPETVSTRLTLSTDVAALSDCDLVVEAVPGSPDPKEQVLTCVQAVIHREAVISSNASSLPKHHAGQVVGYSRDGPPTGRGSGPRLEPPGLLVEIVDRDERNRKSVQGAYRCGER